MQCYKQATAREPGTKRPEHPLHDAFRLFDNESIRYFSDILDTRVFTQIFFSICRILNRESRGLREDSISEELQKLVTRDYSGNISKATCNRAISWLYFSGIIGFCAKITENFAKRNGLKKFF